MLLARLKTSKRGLGHKNQRIEVMIGKVTQRRLDPGMDTPL